MEQIFGDDPLNELQAGAAAMDACGNIGRIIMQFSPRTYSSSIYAEGMDECDTAAVKFDCAKNKEPEMISSMIMNAELNSTAVLKKTCIIS
jgi:hypothetical protein